MSMTVRFPNGQAITYNNANYIAWALGSEYSRLYTDKNETNFIAAVPTTCIVEWVAPCKIENPIVGITLKNSAQQVLDNIREIDKGIAADLKRKLKKFNSRSFFWKK